MVQTIRLIVFHSIKYRESDLLVYAYTPSHGRQTYVLKGYRTTQKRSASARIFPLNILEAEIYYHSGAPVHFIKSLYPVIDLSKIRGDVLKSSIALFLGELLYKSIKEEESHLPLYRFLVESIQTLNDLENGLANFHLYFLTQFCKRLGYAPLSNHNPVHTPFFDMAQGTFVAPDTVSDFLFSKEDSLLFARLSALTLASEAADIPLNGGQRHQFITSMLRYLHYHLGVELNIKSPDVLRQLFQ